MTFFSVMFLLTFDIAAYRRDSGRTDSDRGIAFLPSEVPCCKPALVDPCRRIAFQFPHEIRQWVTGLAACEQMQVIINRIDGEQLVASSLYDSGIVAVQFFPPRILQQRTSVFYGEQDVIIELCIGRHTCKLQVRYRQSMGFYIEYNGIFLAVRK